MCRDIYAQVPPDLLHADDALHRYGRWAKDRMRLHRCGSAERSYRSPPNDLDREPRAILMHIDEAMACQRALARVPEKQRLVLSILYVPRRLPATVQLRIMRVPPVLSRERHILGLRMFDNRMKWLYSPAPGTVPASRHAFWQAESSARQIAVVTHQVPANQGIYSAA